MQKTILVNTLKSLSKREVNKFVAYVTSPFFNKHEKIKTLVTYLAPHYPSFIHPALAKKKVYNLLFPENRYNELKINNLISDTLKLLEGYLVQLSLKDEAVLNHKLLLKQLRQRRLDKHFQRTMRQSQRQQAKQAVHDYRFFYHNYLLEEEADLFYVAKERRLKDKSLQNKVDQLDIFYLSAKLRACCEMINRQNVISQQYELRLLPEMLTYLQHNLAYYHDYPAVTIYYQILMTLLHPDKEEHYPQLMQQLDTHAQQFPQEEAMGMYDYARNYCIKQINNGKTNYLEELFLLYEQVLAKNLLLEEGYILQWDYKNIVTLGLIMRKFDWTEQFILTYRNKLRTEIAENAFYYNLASLYYGKQDYTKSLELLQKVVFTDVAYYLGGKSLLLKIYYDTNQSEPLYSLVDAMKVYLTRNKVISKYQSNIYKNLLRFAKKAYKIKENTPFWSQEKRKQNIDTLKKQIISTKQIANVSWLRQKIEELATNL